MKEQANYEEDGHLVILTMIPYNTERRTKWYLLVGTNLLTSKTPLMQEESG